MSEGTTTQNGWDAVVSGGGETSEEEQSKGVELSGWRAFVARVGYVGFLFGGVFAAWALHRNGLSLVWSSVVVLLTVAFGVWALEWKMPYEESWRPSRKTLWLNVLHTLVQSQVLTPVVKAGLVALVAVFFSRPEGGTGLGIWPSHWPIGIQVMMAVLIADIGVYWAHRIMHNTGAGWLIHAVHHSPTGLNFWASARTHPFNLVVTLTAEMTVLYALGIGTEVFGLWVVYMSINGLLQHSNIDFRPGALSLVLATNEAHRVHHAADLSLSHSNFGNTTMVWDQVFRTYKREEQPVVNVGIVGEQIPENYWSHLAAPFQWGRVERQKKREAQAQAQA